jgi:hypothetical protein
MDDFENPFEPDNELDPILRQRYERLKAELENGDQRALLERLRAPSLFDDDNDEWEHDIGARYRKIKQDEAESGTLSDWGIDLDSLEAKYRTLDNGDKKSLRLNWLPVAHAVFLDDVTQPRKGEVIRHHQ